MCLYTFFLCSYPLMFTNRSSAALWMWKTSSLNRQRQVELCRASFHKDNAAASLFSTAWHRMKPTGGRTGRKCTTEYKAEARINSICGRINGQPIQINMYIKKVWILVSTVLTNNPFLHCVQWQIFTWHLKNKRERHKFTQYLILKHQNIFLFYLDSESSP